MKCRNCGRRYTTRTNTASVRLKTDLEKIDTALHAVAKGLGIRPTASVFKVKPETIQRWLFQAANFAQVITSEHFKGFQPKHVQLDELCTFVWKKKFPEVKSNSQPSYQYTWVWVAIELPSRLIVAIYVGGRTQEDANNFVSLIFSNSNPQKVFWTSDGLKQYTNALVKNLNEFSAIKDFMPSDHLYGQVVKVRKDKRITKIETQPIFGSETEMEKIISELSHSTINTAFIERLNLTLRQEISKLNRRALGFARTSLGLSAHLTFYQFYYNFCRPHHSLRKPTTIHLPTTTKTWEPRTPAMAAGLTGHIWTISELMTTPIPKKIPPLRVLCDTSQQTPIQSNDNLLIPMIPESSTQISLFKEENPHTQVSPLFQTCQQPPIPFLEIKYKDKDNVTTKRIILPSEVYQSPDNPFFTIKSFCFLRNAERNFRSDRILAWKITTQPNDHESDFWIPKNHKHEQEQNPDLYSQKMSPKKKKKKKLKPHGNRHHYCCDKVLNGKNSDNGSIDSSDSSPKDDKDLSLSKSEIAKEYPFSFLERIQDTTALLVLQFLVYIFPSPQTRANLAEATNLARSTLYDTLHRLERYGMVESFRKKREKVGHPLVFWKLTEECISAFDHPPDPSPSKINFDF
jgi:IS1 family transposase/DNA-binding HxlR family transcriptional regulator